MSEERTISVLVVDDHAIAREGLVAVLSGTRGVRVAAQAATGEEAVVLFGSIGPDVTLMDLQLPGIGGIEAIQAIRRLAPAARVIVLTTYGGDAQAIRALKAGAAGYLLKTASANELIEAIRSVDAGGRPIAAEVAAEIASHAAGDMLTQREMEVLRCVAAGMPNKLVARQLSISHETVKEHMRNLMLKLGAGDRTHAVTIALRRQIIDLDS